MYMYLIIYTMYMYMYINCVHVCQHAYKALVCCISTYYMYFLQVRDGMEHHREQSHILMPHVGGILTCSLVPGHLQ